MTSQATQILVKAATAQSATESPTADRSSTRGIAALQRAVGNRAVTALLGRPTGVPLDALTQQDMEARFGHSFGDVRVHTDSDAADSSREMHAAAYTVGRDIAFAAGRYDPRSAIGRRLLAHELAHVVQQDRGPGGESNSASLEASAQGAAAAAGEGIQTIPVAGASGPAVACADETASQVSSSPPDASMGPPRAAPVPNVDGRAETRRLVDALADLNSIQPSSVASGVYDMVIAGKHQQVPKAKVDDAYQKIAKELRYALTRVVNKAEGALESYNSQTAINKDQWFVSGVIEIFGRVKDPGPELISQGSTATIKAAEGMAAVEAGDFVTAADRLAEAEAYASRAQMMYTAYWQHLISVAEMTVTVLEYTEKTAFVTLAILATIASGGAALGAIGAEGVTVAGVTTTASMVGTANLISFGAPAVARVLQSGTKAALGEEVDWGEVAIETIVDIVLYKLGGKLGEGLLGRFAKLAAFQTLGRQALAGVLSNLILHEGSAAFRTTVVAVYDRLHKGKLTWNEFGNQLIAALTDPQGLFFAAVSGAAGGYGRGKAAGVGSRTSSAGSSAETPTEPPAAEPTATQPAAAPGPEPSVATPAAAAVKPSPQSQPPEVLTPTQIPTVPAATATPSAPSGSTQQAPSATPATTEPPAPAPTTQQAPAPNTASMTPSEEPVASGARAPVQQEGPKSAVTPEPVAPTSKYKQLAKETPPNYEAMSDEERGLALRAQAGDTEAAAKIFGRAQSKPGYQPPKPGSEELGADVMPEFIGPEAAPYKSGKTPLREGDIDRYGGFNTKARRGDPYEGHEVLENAWLKAQGDVLKRGTGKVSRGNPSLALTEGVHANVSKAQEELGLHDPAKLAAMTEDQVVDLNVKALEKAGVERSQIEMIKREALKYYESLP
jgi:Domain of unknown function (DUF4157)